LGHERSKTSDSPHESRARPRLPSLDGMSGVNGAVKPLPKYKLVFLGVRHRALARRAPRASRKITTTRPLACTR